MKILEINENEFINLNKVIQVKIKDNRLLEYHIPEYGDNRSVEAIVPGYKLEFELDNSMFVTSKNFETVEEAKMWLYDHNK